MRNRVQIDSCDDQYIYFWFDGLDGDARIIDGWVCDAEINQPGVDLNSGASKEICEYLQEWYDAR